MDSGVKPTQEDVPDLPRSDDLVPEFHSSQSSRLLFERPEAHEMLGMYVPCEANGANMCPQESQDLHLASETAGFALLMDCMRTNFQKQEAMLERILGQQGNGSALLYDFQLKERERMQDEGSMETGETRDLDQSTNAENDDSFDQARSRRVSLENPEEALEIQNARSQTASTERASRLSIGNKPDGCLAFVNGAIFGNTMFAAILANVILVGVEVDVSAQLPYNEIPVIFAILNTVFVCLFSVEITLKVMHAGCFRFFMGEDARWNVFDTCVVLLSVAEIVIDAVISSLNLPTSHLRVFRLLRLVRIFRGMKILRVLRFVGSLRTLLHSVLTTVKSLAWTILLLVLLFYAFGVALTQASSDHCRAEAIERSGGDGNAKPACQLDTVALYWGTLPESMLTLFMAVTGGVSWELCLAPLREVSALAVVTFIAYINFTVLALLNVVTGVFCHSAIESASADKDIAAMVQLSNQKKYAATIRTMFAEIDEDAGGCITLDELESALSDENFCAYLESIEISTSDAWTLFKLIDSDKSGNLDLEEFVAGCMSLRGPASAMQVAKMNVDNCNARRGIQHLERSLRKIHDDLWKLMYTIDKISEGRR
eukprot:TRINITY_DN14331_c0_g2_i1.p1 TRINITY_DN14331_c0_g2~~TRINITY_DN14331_c0_g2_i1.p1  ORF type:complete len:600 (+),score=90.10 TRINITY_DN14331_c0_g2_i1:92-1891(+)